MRYMGFHYLLSDYRGALKSFLDETCETLNEKWEQASDDIKEAANQFEYAVERTIQIFGEKNFSRMWVNSQGSYRRQFNRAILDVMVFYFCDPLIRDASQGKEPIIEEAFKQLCSSLENRFKESVEGNTKNINETYTRLALWGQALLNILDIEFNVPKLENNHIIFDGLRS